MPLRSSAQPAGTRKSVSCRGFPPRWRACPPWGYLENMAAVPAGVHQRLELVQHIERQAVEELAEAGVTGVHPVADFGDVTCPLPLLNERTVDGVSDRASCRPEPDRPAFPELTPRQSPRRQLRAGSSQTGQAASVAEIASRTMRETSEGSELADRPWRCPACSRLYGSCGDHSRAVFRTPRGAPHRIMPPHATASPNSGGDAQDGNFAACELREPAVGSAGLEPTAGFTFGPTRIPRRVCDPVP